VLRKLGLIYSGGSPMRMFIVDDSEILRSRLVQMLSEIKGIEIVGEAGFVRDAVKEIKKLNPDIAILDMKMPDGSGIDIITAMKKDKMTTRIIIFTNYPYLQYRKRCLDAGADFFFYKATEFEKLVDVLKRLLLRPKKSQERTSLNG
jgi:DNA-binding NarL/FixJ family response regulator